MQRILAAVLASACLTPPAIWAAGVSPETLGFESTALGREDTASGIGFANAILGRAAPFTLAAGWDSETTPPDDAILVWLIASPGNPNSALMEVPRRDCRCIVVRITDIRAWLAHGQNVNGEEGLTFDAPYLMAFMLLHEVGHIAAGNPGRLDSDGNAAVLGPQEKLTQEQCREVQADAFAARAIRAAIQNVGAPGWLEASWTANELSKLSWNLFGKRLIEHFPADSLGLAEVFGDPAYSHPNTDLRVYAVNADIAQDDTSKQLLEDFVGKRLKIGRPDITCVP